VRGCCYPCYRVPGAKGEATLQAAVVASETKALLEKDKTSAYKGNLLETLIVASVAMRFGGQPLSALILALEPSCPDSMVPKWCTSHILPGPDFLVAPMDALSGADGTCCSAFFANSEVYASRGLLPVTTMGPGEW
jgi:hypothetical protein